MAGFQFVSPDIAVDIGTDNTRVYVKEKGIVVNEPSVVITRGEGPKNIVAVGDSAEEMIGRAGGILFALIFWYFCIKTKVRKRNKVNFENFF